MNLITRILIYDASIVIGFFVMLTYSLLNHNVYRIKRVRAVVYTFIAFLFGLSGAMAIAKIYNLICSLKDLTPDIKLDMLGALIFTSPLVLAAVYTEKGILKAIDKKKIQAGGEPTERYNTVFFRDTLDLIIPGCFLLFACAKVGCMVRGCCFGVECSWGVYSIYTQSTVFPIQIFESATIITILIVCFYIKQTSFYRRGMAGPLTVLIYAIARFLWEFLRFYTPEYRNFFLGLSLWQLICVLVILIAGVWVLILYKTHPSEPLPKRKLIEALKYNDESKFQKNKKKKKKKKH